MPHKLTKHAQELSTYPVEVAFKDFNGSPITPNTGTIKWSLVDTHRDIVGNYKNQVHAQTASTIVIVLTGDHLQILDGDDVETRYLVVECTYDSIYGGVLKTGILWKDEVEFQIDNLHKVDEAE